MAKWQKQPFACAFIISVQSIILSLLLPKAIIFNYPVVYWAWYGVFSWRTFNDTENLLLINLCFKSNFLTWISYTFSDSPYCILLAVHHENITYALFLVFSSPKSNCSKALNKNIQMETESYEDFCWLK